MPALRVVLDTNVLVSGLAYPGSIPGRIVAAWRHGCLDVVLSRHILDEMARILPRLSKVKLSPAEIRDLVDSFMFLADVVDPDGEQDSLLRDPGDQPVPRKALRLYAGVYSRPSRTRLSCANEMGSSLTSHASIANRRRNFLTRRVKHHMSAGCVTPIRFIQNSLTGSIPTGPPW